MKEVRPVLVLLLLTLCVVLATEWGEDSDEYDLYEEDDMCMGDMDGITINNHNCAQHVQKHPNSCYDAQIYAVCCHSCDVFYLENEDSRPGCEYGDHDEDETFTDDLDGTNFTCKDITAAERHKCSQDGVMSACCASCSQVGQQVSGVTILGKIKEIFDHDEEDFDS
ncbi:uncharacterized protein LOC135492250 [Lineus longissimus]|uniref:uncharacterized protein LOC135492250 n=1 Tax=Lineus longissimus TaxID=88925 RepID=UPI00315CCDA2